MTDKTPIRTVFDGSGNATGLAEFQTGETVGYEHGGTGLSTLGTTGQILKVNSGGTALEWADQSSVNINPYLLVSNANATFVTKAVALSSNNSLLALINDRMQVANVQSLVTTSINNVIDAAPGTLDTLNELAAAIGDDANFITTITSSIGTKASNTYVNTTFVTKSTALTSNNALVNLIDDRLQVANAAATYSTLAQLGNTNSYIASVQSALDTQEAKQALDLANTNSYIADVQTNINVQIGSSNTSIRAFANQTFETKSVALAANNAQNSLINDRLQVANASVLYVTKATALSSNNTLVNLINDRMQVANVQSLVSTEIANLVDSAPETLNTLNELAAALGDDANFAASTTQTLGTKAANTYVNQTFETKATALSSNNALKVLINDRIEIANAQVEFLRSANTSVTNDASTITTQQSDVQLNDRALVNPAGFITLNIGGTNYKLPFFN